MLANRSKFYQAKMRPSLTYISKCAVVAILTVYVLLSVVSEKLATRSLLSVLPAVAIALAPLLGACWLIMFCGEIKHKAAFRSTLAFLLTLYYAVSSIVLLYRVEQNLTFDFFLLWYNLSDAYKTLTALNAHFSTLVAVVAVLAWLYYRGLYILFDHLPTRLGAVTRQVGRGIHSTIAITGLCLFMGIPVYVDNEFERFLALALKRPSDAMLLYLKYFDDSVARNKANGHLPSSPALNENLFLIQLESVNGAFANETIMPNFVRNALHDGVFFARMQGASVQTIRAQETILCSLLPALRENIAQSKESAAGLVCLPQIFKRHGFKTFYFQSYPDFHFANRDLFMKLIGFDELHSRDIMKADDRLLPWGYAEDIFLRRVFEYLARYTGEKIFVHITLSATNHYPFSSDDIRELHPDLLDALPYREPKIFKEFIANTTFLQDRVFGDMYQLYKQNYASNSNMIVFGDHSWPIGVHPGNIANANLAFEENFVSTLAFLPATKSKGHYRIGKRVDRIYSHLDILPTILALYGIDGLRYYGKSFLHELVMAPPAASNRCVVSVQPFGGGFIAAVNFPLKRIYNLHNNDVTTYDLERDPDELSPVSREIINSTDLRLLDNCLNSLAR